MTDDRQAPEPSRTVRTARVIAAPPERLWAAWTNGDHVKAWWGRTDKASLEGVEVDLRIGGCFQWIIKRPDQEAASVGGTIVELSPPSRVVLAWSAADTDAPGVSPSRVTFELVDLKDGSSRAAVTAEGLTPGVAMAAAQAFWSNALQDLASYVA